MSEGDSAQSLFARQFEHVANVAERVGIPIATFAAGAITLWLSSKATIPQLPWLGTVLILASLATYIWLTARSTIRVQSPPAPIPVELQQQLDWMREQIDGHNQWLRVIAQGKENGSEPPD
jgi:hypothetical protein